MLTQNDEALRLHKTYCAGCSEYQNHGGAVDESKTVQRAVADNAGFDSPPPPPDTDLMERLRKMYGGDIRCGAVLPDGTCQLAAGHGQAHGYR